MKKTLAAIATIVALAPAGIAQATLKTTATPIKDAPPALTCLSDETLINFGNQLLWQVSTNVTPWQSISVPAGATTINFGAYRSWDAYINRENAETQPTEAWKVQAASNTDETPFFTTTDTEDIPDGRGFQVDGNFGQWSPLPQSAVIKIRARHAAEPIGGNSVHPSSVCIKFGIPTPETTTTTTSTTTTLKPEEPTTTTTIATTTTTMAPTTTTIVPSTTTTLPTSTTMAPTTTTIGTPIKLTPATTTTTIPAPTPSTTTSTTTIPTRTSSQILQNTPIPDAAPAPIATAQVIEPTYNG